MGKIYTKLRRIHVMPSRVPATFSSVQSVEASAIVRNVEGSSLPSRSVDFDRLPKVDLVAFSNLTNVAPKTGAFSTDKIPTIGGTTHKGKKVENNLATNDKVSGRHPPEYERKLKSKSSMTIPLQNWKQLHIPLDSSAMEDRIYIREFMLRFGTVMNPTINRSYLEELELIGGGFRRRGEVEDIQPWVSESCVKSMILGLLGLLITECHNTEAIKSSIKEIQSTGANLNKIWSALQSLRSTTLSTARSSIDYERLYFMFPDPLPPPASATIHQTRSTRNTANAQRNLHITCSGQMIPILTALIDVAIATNAIRREIETGLNEAKEFSKSQTGH
ncbi:hypothetical protein AX15_004229 [Amanita polypyramis BW_CC]|nr:hypothetical protein AX15_004229 [Amanita polypyramis BW_CC]